MNIGLSIQSCMFIEAMYFYVVPRNVKSSLSQYPWWSRLHKDPRQKQRLSFHDVFGFWCYSITGEFTVKVKIWKVVEKIRLCFKHEKRNQKLERDRVQCVSKMYKLWFVTFMLTSRYVSDGRYKTYCYFIRGGLKEKTTLGRLHFLCIIAAETCYDVTVRRKGSCWSKVKYFFLVEWINM